MAEQYTEEEKKLIRAQLREGNRLAREEIERRAKAERFLERRLQLQAAQRIAQAERMQRDLDHSRNQPVALADLTTLDRDESAARLLFQGLTQHYRECLMAARIDIWADAAHKIVDLLSSPMTQVHKRRSFYDGLTADQKRAALSYRGDENHGDEAFRHASTPNAEERG